MSAVAKAALAIALLAGGSGEPPGTNPGRMNFFVRDLSNFGKGLSARGWQIETVAGKGALNSELQGAARRILTRAKPGDRVLLVFHSHGLKQHTDWGQQSHSIMSEDRDSSGSEPGFDLDRLQPLLLDAEKRGVKTALVDLSCYSGATLSLRGTACTISLASKKYISLCSGRPEERLFASHFMKLPAPGTPVSLEQQFLQARRADLESINLPQISSRKTPAVEAWDEFLENVDPLDIYEDLKDLRQGYKKFAAKKLLGSLKDTPAGFADQLKKVLSLREKIEDSIPSLAKDYGEAELSFELPGSGKLKLSPAALADLLDGAAEKEGEPEDWTDVQRHRLAQIRPHRQAIAAKFRAQVEGFRKRRLEFDQAVSALAEETDSLMTTERSIYEKSSEPVAGQTGCQEFQL